MRAVDLAMGMEVKIHPALMRRKEYYHAIIVAVGKELTYANRGTDDRPNIINEIIDNPKTAVVAVNGIDGWFPKTVSLQNIQRN
jgi:hypothetical protein